MAVKEEDDVNEEERTINQSMNEVGEEETPLESSTMPHQQEEELNSGMERLELDQNVTVNESSIEEQERQQDLWRMQLLLQECDDEDQDVEQEEDREYRINAGMAGALVVPPENVDGESPDSSALPSSSNSDSVGNQNPQEESRPSEDQESENDVSPAQRRQVQSDEAEESESTGSSEDDSGTQQRSEGSEVTLQVNQESDDTPQATDDRESDSEGEAERNRWLEALLDEDVDSRDESEAEEDAEYNNQLNEAWIREMAELGERSGGTEDQEEQRQEQNLEVENQRVSPTEDRAPEPAFRATEEPQNLGPLNAEPASSSHPRIPVCIREVSQPSPGPAYAEWKNSILLPRQTQNQDQKRISDVPPSNEQVSGPPQLADDSSCDDDDDFLDFTLPVQSSGLPPRYNEEEEGRHRPTFVPPFGGAPVNSVRQREQERRDNNRQKYPGPPPPYNDDRNHHNQNIDHRWNGTSYVASNNRNTSNGVPRPNNRDNASRASNSSGSGHHNLNRENNYGYNPGPPTPDGRGAPRNQESREEVREREPMYPGNGDFRDDRSRVSTSPDCSPERVSSRSQGNNRSQNDNRRDTSPLTAANNYGYHPDPPPMQNRDRERRRMDSRQSNRRQGPQDRPQEHSQHNRSPRMEDRSHEHPQNNRQYTESQRSPRNNGPSTSSQHQPSHQPSRSEKIETEREAMARRAEEERLSIEFIKNMRNSDEGNEVEQVSRFYENRRGPLAPSRPRSQNPQPSNPQNQQWGPQQPTPGFNGPPQQQNWGPQPQGPLPYHQNRPAPSPMTQYPAQQQQQYGNQQQYQQMPPPNMGYSQPWNNGPGPSYSQQNQNYNNMQSYQNAPQPMGHPQFQQPQLPPMMMKQSPEFQFPRGPGSTHSGFSGGSSLPVLSFTRESPPITIMRQLMDFLEGYKLAGIPVFISTLESHPNNVPAYFSFEGFVGQYLSSVAEVKLATNNGTGRQENRIFLI